MRVKTIVILALISIVGFAGNPPETSEIRDAFFQGWNGECGATDLYNQMLDLEINDPVLIAYKGAAEMTMANCVGNPWKKYQYFKKGKEKIETAITKYPDNFEIRYLRFAVQSNLPGFLNYNHLEEDVHFLIESLILQTQNSIPDDYRDFVVEHLLTSEELSQEEKGKLNLLISKK
jgi:hypothetical protein